MIIDIEKLTLEDVIVEGMKLWYWLYRNPGRRKINYPGWLIILDVEKDIENECFPCTYCKTDCGVCPLPDKYCKEGGEIGCIFHSWENSLNRLYSNREFAWQMVEGHFEIELPYDIGELRKWMRL
jgi:hypothetical protein